MIKKKDLPNLFIPHQHWGGGLLRVFIIHGQVPWGQRNRRQGLHKVY